ncbi:TPA: hypothetical protein ENS27_12670 [bacterium]|nr:hypothetical protein [bacterium]
MRYYKMDNDAENFRWIEAKNIVWNDVTEKVLDAQSVGDIVCDNEFTVIDDDPKCVLGDHPVFCVPVISLKAREVLEGLWEGKVEYITIKIEGYEYYIVNVLNVLPILDEQNSDIIKFSSSSDKIMEIKKYSFFDYDGKLTNIFKIKNYERGGVFINEAVYQRILSEKLLGFELKPTDLPYENPFQKLLRK